MVRELLAWISVIALAVTFAAYGVTHTTTAKINQDNVFSPNATSSVVHHSNRS